MLRDLDVNPVVGANLDGNRNARDAALTAFACIRAVAAGAVRLDHLDIRRDFGIGAARVMCSGGAEQHDLPQLEVGAVGLTSYALPRQVPSYARPGNRFMAVAAKNWR